MDGLCLEDVHTPHLSRSPQEGREYNNINAIKICACLTHLRFSFRLIFGTVPSEYLASGWICVAWVLKRMRPLIVRYCTRSHGLILLIEVVVEFKGPL